MIDYLIGYSRIVIVAFYVLGYMILPAIDVDLYKFKLKMTPYTIIYFPYFIIKAIFRMKIIHSLHKFCKTPFSELITFSIRLQKK